MQTDILYKQLVTKLNDLKVAIERFERHTPPSTTYTEDLYKALNEANKLTSAYAILKEQKDVSPDLNLHLKLMNVEKATLEVKTESVDIIKESLEPIPQIMISPIIEPIVIKEKLEEINIEPIVEQKIETPIIEQKIIEPITPTPIETIVVSSYPKFTININDKFRIINELFLGNSNEYNMAIEELNTINSLTDVTVYLRELKNIYNWNDESEMVKKLTSLVQKRFA